MKNAFLFAAVVALTSLIFACHTSPKTSTPALSLTGTEWLLVELKGKPVAAREWMHVPTLLLDPATKRASGTSGINRYGAGYEQNGAALKFGMFMGTRMAGPPEAMATENAYLTAMQSVKSWAIKGNTMELSDGKSPLLKFKATSPPAAAPKL